MKNAIKLLLSMILVFGFAASLITNTKAEAKSAAYKMNTKNEYTYQYSKSFDPEQKKLNVSFLNKTSGYNMWGNKSNAEGYSFGERETQKGLYREGSKVLAYPVKEGKSWSDSLNHAEYTIHSVNRTIKTPAGTFKKVVEVRYQRENSKEYTAFFYAPNIGEIKRVYKDSQNKIETIYQLIQLKDHKKK